MTQHKVHPSTRWEQRFQNFQNALKVLENAVTLANSRELSELEEQGLIHNGDTWMQMIECRNLTSHTYDKVTTRKILEQIIASFCAQLKLLQTDLSAQQEKAHEP